MTQDTNHQLKVGLFSIVGVALFCLSVVLLGGDKFFLSRTYHLKIRLQQVQGLGKGSVVSLAGVPVGNVEHIGFVDGSTDVEMILRVQASVQNRITQGSQATIKTQGALGDKYVYITPGPISSPPLDSEAVLEMDKTPDFLDIIASKGAEMGEIVEVIKEVRVLFQNINRGGKSADLMSNLVESTHELKSTLAETRETMRYMRTETLVPLSSVMKKMDHGQGTLGALINDRALYNRISGMLGDAPRNKFLAPLIRDSIQTNESQSK